MAGEAFQQVPDLFSSTPTSAKTGQKQGTVGRSRHVAALRIKGTVQSTALPAGGIEACREFVFSFAPIWRRQRTGSATL